MYMNLNDKSEFLGHGKKQFLLKNCFLPCLDSQKNQGFAWTFLVIILFVIALTFTLNSRYGFINAGTIETLSPYINRELNEYNEEDFVVEQPAPVVITNPSPTLPGSSPAVNTTTTNPVSDYFRR